MAEELTESQIRVEEKRVGVDERRLTLDENRLALDQEIQRERLRLENARNEREGSFFHVHLGVILTGIISIATVVLSFVQFQIASVRADAELAARRRQELVTAQVQEDTWRLNVLQYLTEHREEIYSADPKVREQVRTVLEATLPHEILINVLSELEEGATAQSAGTWSFGVAHSWVEVGVGGCDNDSRNLPPETEGLKPLPARCNSSFEGTIALCAQESCTYKAVDADECGPAEGHPVRKMYQCVPEVVRRRR